MADRSTLIVPNSEFSTKVVRNVTQSERTLGSVQVKLPMPLSVDVEHIREVLVTVFEEHDKILANPPPSVLLNRIEGDKLVLSR